jgi:hypothetical protein
MEKTRLDVEVPRIIDLWKNKKQYNLIKLIKHRITYLHPLSTVYTNPTSRFSLVSYVNSLISRNIEIDTSDEVNFTV